MPFTFAHPALVVPLRRRADLSALVIGSMIPDAAHFLPLSPTRDFTHSLPGLFLFCLPAGWIVWLLFHYLLREPLMALAPSGLSARLPAKPTSAISRDLARSISLGLLLGALTHIAWDIGTTIPWELPFTAVLIPPLFTIASVPIYAQDLLRHGSALIGLGLLAIWLSVWWRRTAAPGMGERSIPHLPAAVRNGLIVLALIAVAAFALLTALSEDSNVQGRTWVTRAIRAALPAASLLVFAYALGWQVWRRKLARHATR